MDVESESFDLREFLEQFRTLLQAQDPRVAAELPRSLSQYGQLCEEANYRLRECFSLIKRGQYSNAVAISEKDPNLLDRCAQLDIPEAGILATVAQVLGVKAPTLLNRNLVEALQEAYQKGSTAAENLRLLHRLTLARAPLPTRLEIMRRLLVQDPNHPFMDADIRAFEKVWFKQALPFVQAYIKQGRPELIQEVMQDLLEGGYFETPPSSLIPNLQSLLAKAQAAQLPTLAEGIRRAFAERSLWTLTQLAARWRSMVAEAGLRDADVSYGVAEALDWLDQVQDDEQRERERSEAAAALSRLIQSPGTRAQELEVAYEAARSRGAVDDVLERRYRSWFEKKDRRRKSILVGSAGAAAAILGVAVLGGILALRPAGSAGTQAGDAPRATAKAVPGPSSKPVPGGRDERRGAPLESSATTGPNDRTGDVIATAPRPDRSFDEDLSAFRKEMQGLRGTRESLDRLARFLDEKIARAPDPEMASRAKLAMDTRPTWYKTLELQETLESGDILGGPIDQGEWKGQPPAGALDAVRAYARMLRHRDPAVEDSEAAKFKRRLEGKDIAGLWFIRIPGDDDDAFYYSRQKPPEGPGMVNVSILKDADHEEKIPIGTKPRTGPAPQSDFAGKAAILWKPAGKGGWDESLAEVDEVLREAKTMDPILKLDLARMIFILAKRTSAGYREKLQDLPAFKAVAESPPLVRSDWLYPGTQLDKQREQARELIDQAPRLRAYAAAAAEIDAHRLAALKRGLVVAGWICREGDGRLDLSPFEDARPAPGSRLYTVASREWIELGSVSADGEIRLTRDAGPYVGWPVFALVVAAGSRGEDDGGDERNAAAAAEKFGGVEIGAKGIKAAAVEVSHVGGPSLKVLDLDKKTVDVTIARLKGKRFDDVRIDDVADVVADFIKALKGELGVPEANIQVVASSGVPFARNFADLTAAVRKRTGKDVGRIDAREESVLTATSLVPQELRTRAMVVDVGSGNTKGGAFLDDAGTPERFVTLDVPYGTTTLAGALEKAAGPSAARAGMARDLVGVPLRKQVGEKPELARRDVVLFSGGSVWALVTIMKPEAALEPFPVVTAADIKAYADRLDANPGRYPEVDFARVQDPAARRAAEGDYLRIRGGPGTTAVFKPGELQAGAALLEQVSEAMEFDRRSVYFDRKGVTGWITARITPPEYRHLLPRAMGRRLQAPGTALRAPAARGRTTASPGAASRLVLLANPIH